MRRFAILAFAVSFAALAQEQPRAQAPRPAAPPAQQPQAQQPPRPAGPQLWSALMTGNKTFMAGKLTYDNLNADRMALREVQAPPITILSCSDSRVPPELVFNQSLGALFVIRTAGNVADDFGVASIEFALLQGWANLIVVLGHENCGAVKAALGGADPTSKPLAELATRLRASFIGIQYDSRDAANVRRAVEMNAKGSVAHLLASSKLIRDGVLTGQVTIVPAYYDFGTGAVTALGGDPAAAPAGR